MSDSATNQGAGAGPGGVPGSGGPGLEWNSFTWHHTHKLDGQKRVAFPAPWRPKDSSVEFMLILWPHPAAGRKHAFILGMVPERFRRLQDKLASGAYGDDRNWALKRRLFSNSIAMSLDPAGRLCLPPDMADAIGLQKDVFFSGGGADFEVWDPETFRRCEQAEETLATEGLRTLI